MDYARLEAGDELRVGTVVARVGRSSKLIEPVQVPSTLAESAGSRAISRTFEPSAGDLRAILDQVANADQNTARNIRALAQSKRARELVSLTT